MENVIQIADGRIYTAKQALANSLVDQIGTMEEALDALQLKYDLYHCDIVDLYYVDNSLWSKIMSVQSKIQLSLSGDLGTVLSLTGKSQETVLTGPVNYYFSY